jgi:hypothetical protein
MPHIINTKDYKGYLCSTINRKICCTSKENGAHWLFHNYEQAVHFMDTSTIEVSMEEVKL